MIPLNCHIRPADSRLSGMNRAGLQLQRANKPKRRPKADGQQPAPKLAFSLALKLSKYRIAATAPKQTFRLADLCRAPSGLDCASVLRRCSQNPESESLNSTLRALEACHDAAFGLVPWSAALQELAESLGAASCVIRTTHVPNPFARRHDDFHGPDSREHFEFSKLWLERAPNTGDPRFPVRGRLFRGTRVLVEDEVISADMRAQHAFYNEVARPGQREWWAAVSLRVDCQSWALSVFRDSRQGRFQVSEKPRLAGVIPYLERTILTANRVLDAVCSGALGTLDKMRSPAMIIDDRGEVLKLNALAELMLGNGVNLVGKRLHASDRSTDGALQNLLAQSRARFSVHSPAVILFRNDRPWLRVSVSPLAWPSNDMFGAGHAIIHFDEIGARVRHEPELLRLVFGLTPAEARLALLLAKGGGLTAAAADLNIGRETARSQLRAIFGKTGTRRQAELAACLAEILQMPVR